LEMLHDQQRELYALVAVVSMAALGLLFGFIARWVTLLPQVAAWLGEDRDEVH